MDEKKISILHIASDEKFINAANYIFEKAFPGCNQFIIPHPRFNKELKYVNTRNNIQLVQHDKRLVKSLAEMAINYDCVVLHGLTELNSTVFLSSKEKNKFIGIFWGAELYTERNFPERSFKGELTKSIQLPKPANSIKQTVKGILGRIISLHPDFIKDATNLAAKELSYFGILYEEEFEFLKEKKLLSEKCMFIPFTYYPLEFIMKGNESSAINGNDILVGNSSSYTNNHLEAFQKLKHINTANRRIVVPLSYGDPNYADYIQEKGTELFNEKFRPLRNFMPLQEYVRELHKCGIVIMNHFRQQAIGNILMMLWLGSKVYLNESNTVYHFLKRLGIIIYSVEEDLIAENPLALSNLSEDEIDHNRKILNDIIGEEHVVRSLKEGISKYFSKS